MTHSALTPPIPQPVPGGASPAPRAIPFVCGLNHVRTPLELRERYALSPEQARALTAHLNDPARGVQALVLSTCNRTEIYACSPDPHFGETLRREFLALAAAAHPDSPALDLAAHPAPLYEYDGIEAVRHLFAVGAGLDSMILGENQIKQQLREAWETVQAVAAESSAPLGALRALMQTAFACGKRIRTETELNVGTLDVGKAAVLKGESVLGSLAGRVCMVVGAGKVGRIAARALAERAPARLLIVNRTRERAEAIAGEVGGEAYGIEALPALLAQAEFILGAAYAPELLLDSTLYRAQCAAAPAASADSAPRVCMVDTAVPRIFDPALAQLDWVELFDIEAMQEIVETNRRRRTGAARKAWLIVEEEVEKYRAALQHADLGPAIAALRDQFESVFAEELPAASPAEAAAQRRLKQRLLHAAIQALKRAAGERE